MICPEWTLAWVTIGAPDMEIIACDREEFHDMQGLKHHATANAREFNWTRGTSEAPEV